MKLFISGDSFAADWSCKYPDRQGWPNQLAQRYDVDNHAQAGVSEYKILRQIKRIDPTHYSHIIIVHTSPYRIPVESNPLHHDDILHSDCDFIYEDVRYSDNPKVRCVKEYFEKFFDIEYAKFIYQLIIDKEVQRLAKHERVLHLTVLEPNIDVQSQTLIDIGPVWKKHPGVVNHLDERGNQAIIDIIERWIKDA